MHEGDGMVADGKAEDGTSKVDDDGVRGYASRD